MRLAIILLFSFSTLYCTGQFKPVPKFNKDSLEAAAKQSKLNILKTNPLSILTGPALATFFIAGEAKALGEFQVGKNSSVEIGASYLFKSPLFDEAVDSTTNPDFFVVQGYRIQAGYRIYVFNKALHSLGFKSIPSGITGFYLGPHASFASIKISDRFANQFNNYYLIQLMDFTLDGGLQMKADRFIVDLYFGLGYKDNDFLLVTPTGTRAVPQAPELDIFYNNPVKMRIGFNLGYTF